MNNVLLSTEVDLYIDSIQPQQMVNVGNKSWLEWHQRLQKLNQQAIVEASNLKEEYVKDTLVTYAKVSVLVHEALLINLWKNKILPKLLRLEPSPKTTFIAYSVLYHEAICVALLELVMYHENGSEALGDAAPDLLDYAYGTASQLLVLECDNVDLNDKIPTELIKQKDDLSFEIGIRSLTILRYLADYLARLPLSVTAYMYRLDVPTLLTEILIKKPWLQDGKQYSGGRWLPWDGEVLITVEAQVWLALRQLLLDPACLTHYEITDTRRFQILKLQSYMSPILIDQLSPLVELQQWVYRLAVSDQPTAAHRPVLLELMLDIKNNILKECEGKWKQIARKQLPNVFTTDNQRLMETAQSLNEAYNTDLFEAFDKAQSTSTTNQCAVCGKKAIQRCSQCKMQWYCSRSCQVSDWNKHKVTCLQTQTDK